MTNLHPTVDGKEVTLIIISFFWQFQIHLKTDIEIKFSSFQVHKKTFEEIFSFKLRSVNCPHSHVHISA